MDPKGLFGYFQEHIGRCIFINADCEHPYILKLVDEDYLIVAQKDNNIRQIRADRIIIPFHSIISIQEIKDLNGIIIYLLR